MRLLDKQYMDTPYYGIGRMQWVLQQKGYQINHKKVARLLRLMGLEALYPKPHLSKANRAHQIYPYLLRGVAIEQVNQVWSTDITNIPMVKGFMYLVAVMDWYSRFVLGWQLSNSLEVDFCLDALESSFQYGQPQIFNSDQGAQFTAMAFTDKLAAKNIRILMDGRGRALANVFIERLWRSVKYEYVYLHAPSSGKELWLALIITLLNTITSGRINHWSIARQLSYTFRPMKEKCKISEKLPHLISHFLLSNQWGTPQRLI